MKEIVELNKADLLKAYQKGTPADKKLLENLYGKELLNINIMDRVKTFNDACDVLGLVHPYQPVGLENIVLKEDLKATIAFIKLGIIARALNEGWTPDWNNSNQAKYYCWFDMRAGFGFSATVTYYDYTNTSVGSRLCFKSRELAEYAGKQFEAIYKDLFTL